MSENGASNGKPELPEGWEWKTLEEIGEALRGITYKKHQCATEPGTGLVPLLRATNILEEYGGVLSTDGLVFVPSALVKEGQYLRQGDIVIASSSGSISVVGKAARVIKDMDATFGAFCTVFRPHDLGLSNYLRWFFQSRLYRDHVSAVAAGSNINNLKKRDLLSVQIPIPPTAVREDLVATVENGLSRVKEIETELVQLRRLQAAVFPSLLAQAFEGGTDSAIVSPAAAGLGEWRTTTLGELCEEGGGMIQTGPFGSQLHASDYKEEGTPVLMPKNLAWGSVDPTDIARIGESDVEQLARHKVKAGDIIQSRRGDLQRRALITPAEDGWICGTGCFLIRVGSAADPHFVLEHLAEPRTAQLINAQARGVTMPNLSGKVLKLLPLKVPSGEDQARVLEFIDSERARARDLDHATTGLERHSGLLRQSILHWAFSGRLSSEETTVAPVG